jgi:hypothetical protein
VKGITDLNELLASLDPSLEDGEFVLVSVSEEDVGALHGKAIGWFRESEGTTAIVDRGTADVMGLAGEGPFRRITLRVHSSLQAVGLLAVVTQALAEAGIAVNVVSAVYHDHLFIHSPQAEHALRLLRQLQAARGNPAR